MVRNCEKNIYIYGTRARYLEFENFSHRNMDYTSSITAEVTIRLLLLDNLAIEGPYYSGQLWLN